MNAHEQLADEKIREAMAAGEFDNLAGSGMPLNLDDYFATPEGWRMGLSVLRSADIIPEEIELLREIGRLRELVNSSSDEDGRTKARQKLAELIAVYDLKMERYRQRKGGPE